MAILAFLSEFKGVGAADFFPSFLSGDAFVSITALPPSSFSAFSDFFSELIVSEVIFAAVSSDFSDFLESCSDFSLSETQDFSDLSGEGAAERGLWIMANDAARPVALPVIPPDESKAASPFVSHCPPAAGPAEG